MNAERQLSHMTLRLLVERADGTSHSGTGFLVGYEQADGRRIYCVTNRHVLEGASVCSVPITESGPDDTPIYGRSVQADITDIVDIALFHPDPGVDLAAFPMHGILATLFRMVESPISGWLGTPTCQGTKSLQNWTLLLIF